MFLVLYLGLSEFKPVLWSALCSVVPQEDRHACSEAASAESRVQAEQDPLVHHHDGLQSQLLLRRQGGLTQRSEGSPTPEHHALQVLRQCEDRCF